MSVLSYDSIVLYPDAQSTLQEEGLGLRLYSIVRHINFATFPCRTYKIFMDHG